MHSHYGEIPDQATLERLREEWGGDLDILCTDCGHLVNVTAWARHRIWHVARGIAAERAAARATVVDVDLWLRARLAS